MPNEYAASYLRAAPTISPRNLRIAGTTALPMYRGKVLYYPLYRNPAARIAGYGLGDGVTGMFSIGSSLVGAITSFAETFAGVIQVVAETIQAIVSFIVEGIVAVVSAVLSAASGLVMATLDALNLKDGGSMNIKEAVDMAGYLQAKYESFSNADKGKDAGLERDMTAEEKEAFDRNMNTSKSKIQEIAGGIVSAVGGETNLLIISGAAAAAMLMLGGR